MQAIPFQVDPFFVSRLFLGGLSEHEQRALAIRLLDRDPQFREKLAAVLTPFERFDLDLMAEYAEVLECHREPEAGLPPWSS